MEETKYLYHYTSLESLALILKNRTIRLNPLDKMDDLQEQKQQILRMLANLFLLVHGLMILQRVSQCGRCIPILHQAFV